MSSNPITIYPYPIGDGFERFTSKGMCPINPYKNFFEGLFSKFEESNFNTNFLQWGLVTLMYFAGNQGKYWNVLLAGAIAGFIGTLFEGGTAAYVCRKGDINTPRHHLISYLIVEVFWIVKEYSIPFLNLYKIKVFSKGNVGKTAEYIIKILLIFFSGCRFYIGYERMIHGLLTTSETKYGHMAAHGIMGLADLEFPGKSKTNIIKNYLQHSYYITIIFVDLTSILVSLMNGITEMYKDVIPNSFLNPFQSIKCAFILLLACDALIFEQNIGVYTYYKKDITNDYKFEKDNNNNNNLYNDNNNDNDNENDNENESENENEKKEYITIDITKV
ncbi:hypothetical protein H8356DRAFT_946250 [Neocallimastix lanati (nom. inval.)]|uniref:Uncharacterized protein n=1 Tax=Neocallimastix californiae TaxID=1754190 RepID=A0A1Y2DGB1_9FUNG|nr:hypothetical protein H8356DRAFT_946250 [Neocallimastix sp. JGI-2020a]ORY58288.1 hypothetical protein LY90DRAFT_506279 [Neocallimastix californiae]|eukprot:ORY58288.1 hypothetical protein LY90DRAFT_506279 [Neocallimastix californiae]